MGYSSSLRCDNSNFISVSSGDTCLSYNQLLQAIMVSSQNTGTSDEGVGYDPTSDPDFTSGGITTYNQGAAPANMSLEEIMNATDHLTGIMSDMNNALGPDGSIDFTKLADTMGQLSDLAQRYGVTMPPGYDQDTLDQLANMGTMNFDNMDFGSMDQGNMYNTDFGGYKKK